MAQAKTRGSKKSSSASARSQQSRSRKPRSSSKTRSTKQRTAKRRSTKRAPAKKRIPAKQSSAATDRLREVPQAVEKTGRKAGRNVAKAASKARAPLLAGGAALAGAASGLAISAIRSRLSRRGLAPRRVKISAQDVAKAARGIGVVSQHVADLTSEMNGRQHGNGNGKRKSPVEVVLDGLTTRR
jgi:hypothetical protein